MAGVAVRGSRGRGGPAGHGGRPGRAGFGPVNLRLLPFLHELKYDLKGISLSVFLHDPINFNLA